MESKKFQLAGLKFKPKPQGRATGFFLNFYIYTISNNNNVSYKERIVSASVLKAGIKVQRARNRD